MKFNRIATTALYASALTLGSFGAWDIGLNEGRYLGRPNRMVRIGLTDVANPDYVEGPQVVWNRAEEVTGWENWLLMPEYIGFETMSPRLERAKYLLAETTTRPIGIYSE